ncbi:MAG TPA: type II secretion system protein [Nitratifractor sp.]|nr:type II secretion system protein [Nitratifractor sp.]HHD74915.1 type II secretion system protein [Nitratifractor sp.]
MRRAFTMIELVFVIAVIGILAAIAVPKFTATRDDATAVKAKTTVASIRSAISTEVQKRMMAGTYTPIANLGGTTGGYDKAIFDYFDGNNQNGRVLEYPPHSCKSASSKGCWMRTGVNTYRYYFSGSSATVDFTVSNNRFDCVNPTSSQCAKLDR